MSQIQQTLNDDFDDIDHEDYSDSDLLNDEELLKELSELDTNPKETKKPIIANNPGKGDTRPVSKPDVKHVETITKPIVEEQAKKPTKDANKAPQQKKNATLDESM